MVIWIPRNGPQSATKMAGCAGKVPSQVILEVLVGTIRLRSAYDPNFRAKVPATFS